MLLQLTLPSLEWRKTQERENLQSGAQIHHTISHTNPSTLQTRTPVSACVNVFGV